MLGVRIAIRTDASHRIGTGHVMRCLALADAARDAGAFVTFICAELEGAMYARIVERGYRVLRFSPSTNQPLAESKRLAHQSWLPHSPEQDAESCKSLIGNEQFDWLLLDHYALDYRWQLPMRRLARRFAVIDDLADRRFDTDVLVDPNPARSTADYEDLVPDGAVLCLGGHYAILRPEFLQNRNRSLARRAKRTSPPFRLLIMFGGVDAQNATGKTLETISTCPDLWRCFDKIDVVMGAQARPLGRVRGQVKHLGGRVALHVDAPNVAALMSAADLSIGGAGSTTWERCCLGLPSLVTAVAENQESILATLSGKRAVMPLSDLETTSIVTAFEKLTPDVMLDMSARAAQLVDGRGAVRILERLDEGLRS